MSEIPTLTLGEYLRRLRRGGGMTLAAAAEKTSLTPEHLCRLENGYAPSIETLCRLATALDGDLRLMLWLREGTPPELLALVGPPAPSGDCEFAQKRKLEPATETEK